MKCVSLVLQNSIKQVAARKTQWDCTKLLHSTPKVSIGHAHYHLDIGSIASVRVCECAMTRAKLKLPNARACKHTYKCKSANTCACARITFKYACTHTSLHTHTLASTRIDLEYLPIFPVVCSPCSHSTPFFAPPFPLFFFLFFQPLPKNALIALFPAEVRPTCL